MLYFMRLWAEVYSAYTAHYKYNYHYY